MSKTAIAPARRKIKLPREDKIMYTIVYIIMVLFIIIVLYPMLFVLSCSLSSGSAVNTGKVILFPVEFSTYGYQLVFAYKEVFIGYANTIFYTVVGTAFNIFMTTLAAYPLARANFQGKKICMTLFVITMFFSGGLIPSYLLMGKLGLINSRLVLIIPGAISTYDMIIMRTFFQNSIPGELQEAAMLDGCSDIRYLLQIVLPLSKAVISVLTLYYAVGHWNTYFAAMIYLTSDETKWPLQLILRRILIANSSTEMMQSVDKATREKTASAGETMKYALIVISTAPILMVYPFIQKYFAKGVMIGSVKG